MFGIVNLLCTAEVYIYLNTSFYALKGLKKESPFLFTQDCIIKWRKPTFSLLKEYAIMLCIIDCKLYIWLFSLLHAERARSEEEYSSRRSA